MRSCVDYPLGHVNYSLTGTLTDTALTNNPASLSPPAFAGQSLYDTRAVSDITESSPKFVFGAGADWTWHKPVMRNDEITTEAWLKDLIEHQTRFAGRAIQQVYHVRFYNQHGDLVGVEQCPPIAGNVALRPETLRCAARDHGGYGVVR